jgi:hypothetical protein
MRPNGNLRKSATLAFCLLLYVIGHISGVSGVPVSEQDAVAVANAWYAMELNSDHLKIDDVERAERFARIDDRRVQYMISDKELSDHPPEKGDIWAYIISYEPNGFTVVPGDDRIEPILVFNAQSHFAWGHPDSNFLSYFLGKEIAMRRDCLKDEVHPNWPYLRSKADQRLEDITFEERDRSIYILWETAIWAQSPFYNDEVIANNGNIPGIPTGCVATAMAIKMRFHEWPHIGQGSHSYDDTSGSIQYSHSVNFGAHTYDWADMPDTGLSGPNQDVADLMYHCGVAVEMNYEVGGSGALTSDVLSAMNSYFRYNGGLIFYGSHEGGAIPSIRAGLPVVMGGAGHAVVAAGYRDDYSTHFYINAGWNDRCNGWYNLDNYPVSSGSCSTSAVAVSCPYNQPQNYIYVDNAGGTSADGTLLYPFETISEGVSAVETDGPLWLKTGTYTGSGNTPILITKPMHIETYQGPVTIGP